MYKYIYICIICVCIYIYYTIDMYIYIYTAYYVMILVGIETRSIQVQTSCTWPGKLEPRATLASCNSVRRQRRGSANWLIRLMMISLNCWGAIDLLKMTLHLSYMSMFSFFFQNQLLLDFFTCIILEGGNFDTSSQIVWNHLNPCIFGQAFAGPRAATGISTYRGNVGLVWDR